jgi:ankyrin repeat protein
MLAASSLDPTQSLACVRVLVAGGARPDLRTRKGATALHYAAYLGSAEVIRFLAMSGGDINAREDGGGTPLSTATRHRRDADVMAAIQEAIAAQDSRRHASRVDRH